MFQFGLLSTHLPYILTILAYLVSYGFFAFNKTEQQQDASVATANTDNHLFYKSVPRSNIQNKDCCHFYATAKKQDSQTVSPFPFVPIKAYTINYSQQRLFSSLLNSYELFSRPPTSFC